MCRISIYYVNLDSIRYQKYNRVCLWCFVLKDVMMWTLVVTSGYLSNYLCSKQLNILPNKLTFSAHKWV